MRHHARAVVTVIWLGIIAIGIVEAIVHHH
jgi:hypothetical protein